MEGVTLDLTAKEREQVYSQLEALISIGKGYKASLKTLRRRIKSSRFDISLLISRKRRIELAKVKVAYEDLKIKQEVILSMIATAMFILGEEL